MGLFQGKPALKSTGNDKLVNRNCVLILVGNFIFVIMMVHLLPNEVLEKYSTLKILVNYFASYILSIADFGRYSEFPQVSQLVFSIEIITMPFIIIYLHALIKLEIDVDAVLERPIFNLIIAPLILLGIAIIPLFLIPGEIDNRNKNDLIKSLYYSKFAFSVGMSILILGWSLIILILIEFLKGVPKLFR